jgi:hypothetical protein
MERSQRFKLFLKLLMSEAASATMGEAKASLARTMNRIEDERSGAVYDPDKWESDGRMYPPKDDRLQKGSNEDVAIYHSRGHRISFGRNGAIRIEVRSGHDKGAIVLDKCGQDGNVLP